MQTYINVCVYEMGSHGVALVIATLKSLQIKTTK